VILREEIRGSVGMASVLSNMIVSIEQHVDWITDCLAYMRDRGFEAMEANEGVEDKWVVSQRGCPYHAVTVIASASEAIHGPVERVDCFVAALLAMTEEGMCWCRAGDRLSAERE